jgi:hypothetical protein
MTFKQYLNPSGTTYNARLASILKEGQADDPSMTETGRGGGGRKGRGKGRGGRARGRARGRGGRGRGRGRKKGRDSHIEQAYPTSWPSHSRNSKVRIIFDLDLSGADNDNDEEGGDDDEKDWLSRVSWSLLPPLQLLKTVGSKTGGPAIKPWRRSWHYSHVSSVCIEKCVATLRLECFD